MLKSMIEKIVSLAAPTTYQVEGKTFCDKDLVQIEPDKYHTGTIFLNGLDSVCKMVRNEIEHVGRKIFIQAWSYQDIRVFSTYDKEHVREYMYECKADTPEVLHDRFMDQETAIIQLQSLYVPNNDMAYLLELLSNISVDSKVGSSDNGVSQTIEARRGVSLAQEVSIKPIVSLIPYRTFLEVPQPESNFLLRVNNDGEIGLFEADGGVWKLEATRNIANYFEENLKDLIEKGFVVVIR